MTREISFPSLFLSFFSGSQSRWRIGPEAGGALLFFFPLNGRLVAVLSSF